MLRLLNLSFILLSAVLLTSCFTIEEVLQLNADGSGTLKRSINLGALVSNPMMKMAVEAEMSKNGGAASERIDSVINLVEDLRPFNPQWTEEDIRLLEKVESRMIMDFDKGEGGMYVTIPFDDVASLMRTQQLLRAGEEQEQAPAGNPLENMASGDNFITSYTWKKGKFGRVTEVDSEAIKGFGNDDSDEMAMAKMMLADAKLIFKTIYPGKIKKVKGFQEYRIEDDNTLVQEFDMLHLFEASEVLSNALNGQVKYKK